MTGDIRSSKYLRIETDNEHEVGFLCFGEREEELAQIEDVQMTDDAICSLDTFADEDDTSDTSTTAHASLRKQLEKVDPEKEEFKWGLARYEG
uniref:Uncharacterized protein n=1 Tax=Glossina pallidipes TaxID=7398 RepID=A0A1A9ZHJ0_GLOPL